MSKLETFLELMQIAETAFIYKLKKKKPNLTDKEIEKEICNWYLEKPEPEFADCIKVDIDRLKI